MLDYPLGVTAQTAPVVVMANVLGGPPDAEPALDERVHHLMARWPDVKIHLYGKGFRPGRKVGHVTALGGDLALVRGRARRRRTTCPWDSERRWMPMSSQPGQPDPLQPGPPQPDPLQPDPPQPDGAAGGPAQVGVIMGSDSDWTVMAAAAEALAEFGVPFEVRVVSAHRTPEGMLDYARSAAGRGLRVIIAGAGGAAHLPGMVASLTPLPVIGVPVPLQHLDGMDSLLSIVQMPAGVPVATVSIGGARNAGLLAVRILAASDERLRARMEAFQAELAETALSKDRALGEKVRTLDW